jgi:uncharacterized protein YbjT (DUF2867 family)
MRILVTGASGFAGSLLVPRLLHDGHAVRALGRDPARVSAALAGTLPDGALPDGAAEIAEIAEIEVVRGDALSGAGLDAALAGVDVAYYLIHSMERPAAGDSVLRFDERDLIAARNFADACVRAHVSRIVYLGGLLPRDRAASRHLTSRESVERTLLGAVPDSLALRASIVIGARSRSFRFLVRLVERMPVLALPAWRSFRTTPIDERDVIEMLAAAATVTGVAGRPPVVSLSPASGRSPVGDRAPVADHSPIADRPSFADRPPVADRPPIADLSLTGRSLDIGGPDVLSYGEMISRIADLMLVRRRPVLGFGVNLTPVTARVAAAIASEDPDLILPLMESLAGDLLPGGGSDSDTATAAELLGVRLHSFDSAVEHALRVWEESEPLSAR